jgi:hypothetical protein
MPDYIQNQPSSQITNQNRRGESGAVKPSGSLTHAAAHLGLTLDASSSMRDLVDPATQAVNRLLAEQKGVNPQSRFTSTSFGDSVRAIIENAGLADAPLFGRDLYRADGSSTALNDGILDIISRIGKQVSRSVPVLIAILTDGGENSSRGSIEDVFSVITYRRTTYHWGFVFIGPPQAQRYALSIGIPKSNFVSFSTDPAGIRSIIERLSKSMAAYQLGDSRMPSNSETDPVPTAHQLRVQVTRLSRYAARTKEKIRQGTLNRLDRCPG